MNLLDTLSPQTPPPVVGARVIYPHGAPESAPQPQAVVTASDRANVLRMRKQGYTFKDIGKRLKMSATHARRIYLQGTTWAK